MDPVVSVSDYESIVVLAVVIALCANLLFLFKVMPWRRPGSWRRIFILASVASAMFMISEATILTDSHITALDTSHQVPLFAALLAGASGFFLVYTDAYRSAERSRVLALTDAVTELPNRRAFEEHLKRACALREKFALLYIDLDGFKQVNDSFGHDTGDDVLRDVAGILRRSTRGADLAARVGGDEFCVVLPDTDRETTRLIAERVLKGLATMSRARNISVSASFGVATDTDGAGAYEIVAAADRAMYRAKKQTGDRIAYAVAQGSPTA